MNDADKGGNTPLHVAARAGFHACVKMLIHAGAHNSSNRAGKTPAQVAADHETQHACEAAV